MMSAPVVTATAAGAPEEKTAFDRTASASSAQTPRGNVGRTEGFDHVGRSTLPWHRRLWRSAKTPGSAIQIITAAVLAIAIGMAVTTTVPNMPAAAVQLVAIPGTLWLRALRAVVLPLIITAMILAVVRLREMTGGGAVLARWTIGYYVGTTIIAILHTIILTDLAWRRLMTEVGGSSLTLSAADQKTVDERKKTEIHTVVVQMFESLVPKNVFEALATDGLLAILVASVVVGYLINPMGHIIAAVEEVEVLVTKIITFLIKVAPIGVFFLILPNLFRLDIAEIGRNLGVLIGSAIAGMILHLFVIIPIIVFAVTRRNPYAIWLQSSRAWLTAWGTASSAATLPITMREAIARGVPVTIAKFSVPLGRLVNMDGTAIYFPICVVFLAATQGITLNAAQYTIIVLLSTLASIGTTPIPSSSLVLTVMIAGSVDVPITGMYGVIVAIDWFVDRFRTATNVSADIFAAAVVSKITGIKDVGESSSADEIEQAQSDAERVSESYALPAAPPPQADNSRRV